MRALVLTPTSLQVQDIDKPIPTDYQVLIQVEACGLCRTDLHIIDKELPQLDSSKIPQSIILGHQIVGRISSIGKNVKSLEIGKRVGVTWLGNTCQSCSYCLNDQENLCDSPQFTGFNSPGGMAQYCCADAQFIVPLDDKADPILLAPLLCAGIIGYRTYLSCLDSNSNAKTIGIYGFGSAAHLLTQLLSQMSCSIHAFTKENDLLSQKLAINSGAKWAGGINEKPVMLDAAIIFASAGDLVTLALKQVKKGGTVVCGGIHMSDIPSFPYEDLWNERSIKSVANLKRSDALSYFKLIEKYTVTPQVTVYSLENALQAIIDLKNGQIQGSTVIRIEH
ncbi:MAG: alcohol dehydrogenase catalytic domain-containing protein [Parachlamydiales bacterium]|nr:alcohol dehydrogenase catalytic domain-containing protein [Parachlamydiales bacterium]